MPPRGGALLKRGEKKGSGWKARYFALLPAERKLQYFTCSGGAKGAELHELLALGAGGAVVAAEGEAGEAGAAAVPKLTGEVRLRNIGPVRAADACGGL